MRVVSRPGRFFARVGLLAVHVGDLFARLSQDEQAFVLAHEEGHLQHNHVARRVLWALALRPLWDMDNLLADVRRQEHEADLHAVRKGHVHGFLAFMNRIEGADPSPFHPTVHERIMHVVKHCGDLYGRQ